MSNEGRALLICAGGGIGDSLLASLCARALRSKYKYVDALTLPGHRETLEHVPDLDEVYVDDGDDVYAIAAPLFGKYAAAVITWATQRTADIAYLAKIPVRAGQSNRLYSSLFTHRVPVRSERGDVTSHWSQILLDYPRAIGCDLTDTQPRFDLTVEDRSEAANLLAQENVGGAFGIVHPTCSVSPKRPVWPLRGWIELVHELQARYRVPVLVSGAPADAPIVQPLVDATGAICVAGATSIGGFGALAERAKFLIVMHSGPMHIAAALGTPTVGIFPLQADFPDRWAPLGPRVSVSRASYACRAGERMETCPDYLCVANLSVPRVLASLDGLLRRGGEEM